MQTVIWCLATLNGILEDDRSRVSNLISIQKSHKKCDAIKILWHFLQGQANEQNRDKCELAAHTLAVLVANMQHGKWDMDEADNARSFLQWLMGDTIAEFISCKCRSACLLLLVKNNLLARHFVENSKGFDVLSLWLSSKEYCQDTRQDQLTYNTLAILWTVSVHDFTLPMFEEHEIVQHVAKILDYYNKEKIVRIALMLFQSVSRDKDCMDQLSMVNAMVIVAKL